MSKLLIFLFIYSQFSIALVEPPNYDFSLKTFEPLSVGSDFNQIKSLYPKIKLIKENQGISTYELKVSQLRYVFPAYIKIKDNKVIDLFARLPQYFLHDLFHQSLINKIGMQDVYKKVEEHAVYKWNKENIIHVYEGACTITCFPIYYSQYLKTLKNPLLMELNHQEPTKRK